MYLSFFKLKEEPFNITPDPEFLFLSASHKEALAALIYGVEKRKGFIALIGEVGVGKTTILRAYMNRLDRAKVRPIYLFNSSISFTDLLIVICQELALDIQSDKPCEIIVKLHERLIHEYRQGRNVVLIIDEAQNMSVEALENLRLLSNLETSKDKLIQVVFSAQPEFEQLLGRNELRQLRQRIAVKATIRSLGNDESLAYINHRLSKAAVGTSSVFSSGAMKLIARHAKGIPRTINILCDNCLITSFGYKRQTVNERIAKEIIADLSMSAKTFPRWRLVFDYSLLGICCVVAIYLAGLSINGKPLPAVDSGRIGSAAQLKANPPTLPVPGKRDQGEARPGSGSPTQTVVGDRSEMPFRVVKRGDTLAKLILEKYGYINREVVEQVIGNNQSIKNANWIIEGERIFFPAVTK